jgi:hypothetical protein
MYGFSKIHNVIRLDKSKYHSQEIGHPTTLMTMLCLDSNNNEYLDSTRAIAGAIASKFPFLASPAAI